MRHLKKFESLYRKNMVQGHIDSRYAKIFGLPFPRVSKGEGLSGVPIPILQGMQDFQTNYSALVKIYDELNIEELEDILEELIKFNRITIDNIKHANDIIEQAIALANLPEEERERIRAARSKGKQFDL